VTWGGLVLDIKDLAIAFTINVLRPNGTPEISSALIRGMSQIFHKDAGLLLPDATSAKSPDPRSREGRIGSSAVRSRNRPGAPDRRIPCSETED